MNKLRECITANPIGTEGWALGDEFDCDAIRILQQRSESENIYSRACMLVDQIHDGQGVKLADELDSLGSYRLQSADTAPSSPARVLRCKGMAW